jgi:hypothetical protein
MNKKELKWECEECGSSQTSNPKERHTMDWCKCGRFVGSVKIIDAEDDGE